MKLYCLHDTALEAFGGAMTYTAHGQALRDFSDQVNDPQSPIHKHPEHYTLMYLGEYDNQSGQITQPPGWAEPKAKALEVIVKN